MEENCNYSKLEKIYYKNGGCITRRDVDNAHISSWFLSDFVRKNKLIKLAPGFYAGEHYMVDEYYVLQYRFPQYVYAGMSALYLHHLTDRIPSYIEVVCVQGYHPTKEKNDQLSVRKVSNSDIYQLGICEVETMFGNKVRVYNEEKTICDMVKMRSKYDSEVFTKAIRFFLKRRYNEARLFEYARAMKIENELFAILEMMKNNDE